MTPLTRPTSLLALALLAAMLALAPPPARPHDPAPAAAPPPWEAGDAGVCPCGARVKVVAVRVVGRWGVQELRVSREVLSSEKKVPSEEGRRGQGRGDRPPHSALRTEHSELLAERWIPAAAIARPPAHRPAPPPGPLP